MWKKGFDALKFSDFVKLSVLSNQLAYGSSAYQKLRFSPSSALLFKNRGHTQVGGY